MSQGNKTVTTCGDGESCALDFGDDPEGDDSELTLQVQPQPNHLTSRLHELMHQEGQLAFAKSGMKPITILPRRKD